MGVYEGSPAKRRSSSRTAEERAAAREAGKAKAAAAVARLESELERLAGSDDAFAEYLRLAPRMHGYSLRNRILIMLARPDARMVAGFHKWRELGRPVVKGAKGIQILAPMTRKVEGENAAGELETRVFTSGFRVAYVFAVEDTDGPMPAMPDAIASDDDGSAARELVARLEAAAAALGVVVTCRDRGAGDHPEARGFFLPADGSVTVFTDAPAAMIAKTIAHELAHALEHRADVKASDDRPAAELVAECVAFTVMSHYGIDTGGYSVPYIAGYTGGDVKRLGRLLDRLQAVAGELLEAAEGCGSCRACGWDGVSDGGGCEVCR